MIFFRLKPKHKVWYIINKVSVFIALAIAFLVAMNKADIHLPTRESKLTASLSFIILAFIFIMASLNRVGSIFKIKSVGFVIFFFLFLGLEYIITPAKIAVGYMMIPLLVDDLIFLPIWLNIWHNNYANEVRLVQ